MLTNNEFDLWSTTYNDFVKDADKNDKFPFAGYNAIMNAIYGTIMNNSPARVLDIGFGTAMLTEKLYNGGNTITGFDFSPEMLKTALTKMPEANLFLWDFTNGLPPVLNNRTFDFIISTYALHHLSDESKADFITDLLSILEPNGSILIADVCFLSRDDLISCRESSRDSWDDDEIYFVVSELKDRLCHICSLSYHEFSFCSGILELRKNT